MNYINFLTSQVFLEATFSLAAMFLFAYFGLPISRWLLKNIFKKWKEIINTGWADILLSQIIATKISQISPSLIVQLSIDLIPHIGTEASLLIKNVAVAITIFYTIRVILAVLNSILDAQSKDPEFSDKKPKAIKSYIQLSKIIIIAIGSIIIISTLIDRSPLILLSGLGAMSAVLLIVFKDTLTSFTAGLQLTANDMLRVGDWIEMPQVGADGDVIDIALHTVIVQNWDNTITAIPTWRLMSESFKNWRGMSDSGGRRIKKTLLLDASSIKFLNKKEIDELKKIILIEDYINEKVKTIENANTDLVKKIGDISSVPTNQRRLTNLGTFRAYVNLYLASSNQVHKQMTRIVRVLKPSANGVPLEIYCFTSTTDWRKYEGIQSDIFEHFLAVLPEFGLKIFQMPTGNDLKKYISITDES